MSEALDALVNFDDAPRNGARADGAAARIAETLKERMADAPDALYNESLTLAREGHLGQAVTRLNMLLCLDPDDADALLLLAKVHAAQGRPSEALARLDAAVAAGTLPPIGLREQLESAIRAERLREEESRARVASREKGEVAALRHEARTLRSETIRLEAEVTETRDRENRWKMATVGASLFGTAVILLITFLQSSPPPAAPARTSAEKPAIDLSLDGAPGSGERLDGPVAPASRLAGRPTLVRGESQPAAAAAPAVAEVAPSAPVSAPISKIETPPAEAPKVEAPTAKAEPVAKAGPTTHVVGSGDTLYKLAKRYYGDSSKWERIRDANASALKKGIDLKLGQELVIPAP
jgi:nucleoid-associated protein YgaU